MSYNNWSLHCTSASTRAEKDNHLASNGESKGGKGPVSALPSLSYLDTRQLVRGCINIPAWSVNFEHANSKATFKVLTVENINGVPSVTDFFKMFISRPTYEMQHLPSLFIMRWQLVKS